MSTEVHPPSSSNLSVHVPVTFLAIAISLFLFGERAARRDVIATANLNLQMMKEQGEQLDTADAKYKAALVDPSRVKQADDLGPVNEKIAAMMTDLKKLATEDDDPEAKELLSQIASQLGLTFSDSAPGGATPAPATAPGALPAPK